MRRYLDARHAAHTPRGRTLTKEEVACLDKPSYTSTRLRSTSERVAGFELPDREYEFLMRSQRQAHCFQPNAPPLLIRAFDVRLN